MATMVLYYIDGEGKNPVWDFISRLPTGERDKCFEYIEYLEQTGERVRRPVGDYLGNKLYELRPKQVRIIYFFYWRHHVVLVHAFRKKTDAIPRSEITTALKRMNNFIRRVQSGEIEAGE